MFAVVLTQQQHLGRQAKGGKGARQRGEGDDPNPELQLCMRIGWIAGQRPWQRCAFELLWQRKRWGRQ